MLLFAYAWPAASMLAAYAVKRIEVQRGLSWLARPLLYLVGYGPLLCAITAAAYVEEARGSALVWEKTEKLERALFWRELLIVALVAGVLVLRGLFG
jgi:hypothetical protein